MATREKKLSVGRKQNTSSPLPQDEVTPVEQNPSDETPEAQTELPLVKKLASKRKITRKPRLAIKLKPKIKPKIKPRTVKNILSQKKLKKQAKPRKSKNSEEEILPPVLEPIFPIDENVDKDTKKKNTKPPRIDKIKVEEPNVELIEKLLESKTKKVFKKKIKAESTETLEDVMKDLSSLIKDGDIKKEPELESSKPKKAARKKKKENIEIAERNVIDMLDLNVRKVNKGVPNPQRRHSIEKFPIGTLDADLTHTTIFNNPVRCASPRSKNPPRIKQSDGSGKRTNPYRTRSEFAPRMLRNGKYRKLKDLELLDGLDLPQKRRRRNCSDYSGSEMSLSKSGYESDSSFSDMSSLHGTENGEAKEDVKVEAKEDKTENNLTDTNSNLCGEVKEEEVPVSPSLKVPEKSIILDIMKQKFNDENEKRSKVEKPEVEVVSPSTFYGTKKTEEIPIEQNEPTSEVVEINKSEAIEVEQPPEPEPEATQNGNEATIEETPENMAIKESILQALGLQSLKAAKEARMRKEKAELKNIDSYTGTLKTVIKISRDRKKGKNPTKITLHSKKGKILNCDVSENPKPTKEFLQAPSTSWKHGGQSSDTAGAHRKSHYSNRSNMDGSSEHTSDGEPAQEGTAKALVIPEKASSFSIHPGRLCKDECSYCFGKFGLFDTPCHIAQMKSEDRQNKILGTEKHLTRDSCLCDACYRHVDRKANTPSYMNKSYKRSALVAPGPRQDHCHVLGCGKAATNILRRKWIIKMKKSICEAINLDLDNPGLHSIPICDEHYSALEHLMVCAMCKRRLAKNHVHYLGPETRDLNGALNEEGIPLTLSDKPVVCKLCKYFACLILKPVEQRPENGANFLREYKKRLLHFNDIIPMDEAAAEEPIIITLTRDKTDHQPLKKKRKLSKNGDLGLDAQEAEKSDHSRVPSSDSTNQSRSESPSDYMVDYNTLIPSIAMECGSDTENSKKEPVKPTLKKIPRPETVKQAVEISKNMKLQSDKNSDIAVQRLGSNPSISVRQLFPCEEDLPLQGHVEFGNVKERTPEGWEKCTSVIQYDMETKQLWQELQKPYGNQSSFLRHLILLEKYFRNGDLILAPNASHHSLNYTESVNNRLRAYDNIPANAGNVQALTMIPTVVNRSPQKSHSGIMTSSSKEQSPILPIVNAANIPKNTPITISQLNSPPLVPVSKPKPLGAPPGLISLQPGTNKPVAPIKPPQSQKIKFPITKNWRPNLIPIDPSNNTERKTGLVQVISGGKPYHITLEDYKKMCAIKKSFELKQKRLQEAKTVKTYNSVLKSVPRKNFLVAKGNKPEKEENIIDKLDKQVEKLDALINEKPALSLPKIPKSLTVIPQTVTRKPSRPSSPILLITQKPKQKS